MSERLRQLLALPEQASSIAADVDGLHIVVIGTTMLGATAVFATAIAFSIRFRRRDERQLTPPVRAPYLLDLAVVGALFSLFLAFWIVGYRQYLRMQVAPSDALEIYAVGRQWMWKFAYPHGARTNAVLVVPAGRPVRLVMTSRDVIHSLFVPAFRLKQDVLPGRTTTLWFEARRAGTWRLFCAEYCGTGHSRMWADVVALDPADWERWRDDGIDPGPLVRLLGEQGEERSVDAAMPVAGRSRATMAEQGREVAAAKGCLSCHTLDGQSHLAPSFRGLFGSERLLADGRRVVADEAYLTRSMMEPRAQVVAGYRPIMPTYQGLLDPAEVGALLELIRSLRLPLQPGEGEMPALPRDLLPAEEERP